MGVVIEYLRCIKELFAFACVRSSVNAVVLITAIRCGFYAKGPVATFLSIILKLYRLLLDLCMKFFFDPIIYTGNPPKTFPLPRVCD